MISLSIQLLVTDTISNLDIFCFDLNGNVQMVCDCLMLVKVSFKDSILYKIHTMLLASGDPRFCFHFFYLSFFDVRVYGSSHFCRASRAKNCGRSDYRHWCDAHIILSMHSGSIIFSPHHPWCEKYSTVIYLITVTDIVTYHMTAVLMIWSYRLSCIIFSLMN